MPIKKPASFNDLFDSFNTIGTSISHGAQNITFTAATKRISEGNPFTGMVETTMNAVANPMSMAAKPKPSAVPHATTEFSLDEFSDFVGHTLSEQLEENTLLPLQQCLELDNHREALNELEQCLLSLLKSHSSLPTSVVAQLHTYLGLIYLELNNNSSAVDSLTRAIWFQSRTPENTVAIAQANHRLGLAYGCKKEFQQATELIDRAISGYDPSSEHYLMAKEDRHAIQEAQQLELLTKNSRYTIRPDMEKTVLQNQRVSRRRRNQRSSKGSSTSPNRVNSREKSGPERRKSFGSLKDILSAVGPSLQRQATAPIPAAADRTMATKPQLTRRSTSPIPKKREYTLKSK